MKTIKHFIGFLSVIIMLTACTKDSLDLFKNNSVFSPEVSTISARMSGDTLILTGEVSKTGSSSLEYTGFCFSQNPLPQLKDNQILLGNEKTFHAYVFNLTPLDTYYFRAFAANENGWAYGNILEYVIPKPQPVVAPCTLANSKITIATTNYGVSSSSASSMGGTVGNFEIMASCYSAGGFDYYFDFLNKPLNGTYITSQINEIESGNPYNKNVYIGITGGLSGTSVESDGIVYVNVVNDVYTVSFCDLKININGKTYQLKGKFTAY